MAKKKSNPHSQDNNKPTKTEHQIPDDDVVSEKLDSLKSLNAMLLKETVERRHQVDSLTQINASLESDLNRCNSDKVSLESELNGLSERAVRLEIEKELVCRFVAVQVNEMAEINRRERVAMDERIGDLERDVKRSLEEKNVIERVNNKKELEIDSLNNKLNKLVAEFGEEKSVFRAQIDERIKHENGLRSKLGESEKREAEVSQEYQTVKAAYDQLVHEKMEMGKNVDLIMIEKNLVERKLAESNASFSELKRDFEMIVKEKKAIEDKRNMEERKKNELNELVHKLQKGEEQLVKKVADLEEKCVMGLKKEAEMRMKIDLLVKECENSEANLNNEKLAAKKLHEKISKLEKGIEETHKLVAEKNALADSIHQLKNSLVITRKEHDDTKAKLSRSEANSAQILKILKTTSSMCISEDNDDMGVDQEIEFGEDIKDHVTEIEAIKKAFNMLKLLVAKADKGKRFWRMVTSGTTVLAAAVSLAYVTGGGC